MFDKEGFRAINKPKPLEHRRITYLIEIYNLSVDKRKKAKSILQLKRAQQTQKRDFFFKKDTSQTSFLVSQWAKQLDKKLRLLRIKGYPGHVVPGDLQLIADCFVDLKQKTFLTISERSGKRLRLDFTRGIKCYLKRLEALLIKKPFSKKFNDAIFLELCHTLDQAQGQQYHGSSPQEIWQSIFKKIHNNADNSITKALLYQQLYSQYEAYIDKQNTECNQDVINQKKASQHETAGLELCKKITQSSVDEIEQQDDILKSIHQLRKQTQDIVRNLSRRLSPS